MDHNEANDHDQVFYLHEQDWYDCCDVLVWWFDECFFIQWFTEYVRIFVFFFLIWRKRREEKNLVPQIFVLHANIYILQLAICVITQEAHTKVITAQHAKYSQFLTGRICGSTRQNSFKIKRKRKKNLKNTHLVRLALMPWSLDPLKL